MFGELVAWHRHRLCQTQEALADATGFERAPDQGVGIGPGPLPSQEHRERSGYEASRRVSGDELGVAAVGSRSRARRVLAAGAVVVVVLTIAAVSTSAYPERATAGPGVEVELTAPDAERAAAQARETGAVVEALSLRTGDSRTLANPDGSWTYEKGAQPTRARAADGTWVPIDLTLRAAAGAARPVAAAVDVRFSMGGTGPFATLRTAAGVFSLSWPGTLPTPLVGGNTAVYLDVLAGVDLVVRATPEGFGYTVVVKNREAASDPAVQRLQLALASGLTYQQNADGMIEAVNGAGEVAVTTGDALMWDSATDAVPAEGGEPATSSAVEPGAGARQANVGVSVDGGSLVLTPDAALLNDPATVFPVYIDPPSYGPKSKRFAYANSNNENNSEIARIGKSPKSGARYRSFFAYDVARLKGTRILSAVFRTTLTHSWSCASTPLNLYRTSGIGSGRLAWSGPSLDQWIDERSAHAHKGKNDCGNQDDAPMEFGRNLTSAVQTAANSGWNELVLGLSTRREDGSGEGTESWWKKVSVSSSVLSVVYNSKPGIPTNPSSDGTGCGSGATRPVIASATPTLRAKVADPDPGETDLTASFAWQRYDTSITPAAWVALGSGQQRSLRSGDTGQYKIGSGLVNGGIYRWRAQALDPWAYDGASGTDPGDWSVWCEFTVDTVSPSAPPGVSSPVYGADPNLVYGAVGRTADFTFTASGISDVASYRWGWQDPPATTVAASALGGPVTVALTPPPPKPADPTSGGVTTLYVVSVDRAGRTSAATLYTFSIGSATAPVGRWDMADPAGSTTLADSSGGGRTGTVSGGLTGADSRLVGGGTSLSLDGVDDYASVPAVPLDTSRSFTVSAWVRVSGTPASTGTGRAAVTASGDRASAFFLRRYRDGRWMFGAAASDVDSSAQTNIYSTSVSRSGVWTHIAGVYDAGTAQIQLYVNGVREASGARAGVFRALRTVEFGRTKWNGNINYEPLWQGSIAEVRLWDRVVSDQEMATLGATLTGRWGLDGDGADSSPFHRNATFPDTVLWTEGHNGMPFAGVSLNGAPEALIASGPALRTDQSYTVSSWVRLREPVTGRAWTAVGQDGPTGHGGFLLGARPDSSGAPAWFFLSFNAATTSVYTTTRFTDATGVGDWVHLTAVYDAQAAQQRLYVNGDLAATTARTGMVATSGPVTIGRGMWNGSPVDWWAGEIDEVRVYQGVLPASEIDRLAAR